MSRSLRRRQQQAPLLTAEELVPEAFRRPVGKSNSRAELDKIPVAKTCEIIAEILKHHPIRTALTTSATVPIVYMQQLWQTVKLTDSNTIIRFKIDQHEVDFSLDTFRTVLQLPQATDNQNESFVDVPGFSGIVAFLKDIGYDGSIRIIADFKVKNLTQPWQTLFKIINRCTTTKSTGLDGARIGTLQILWGVVNKVHIDYAELIWEDIIYHIMHPGHKADTIPFPRYAKLIINHILSIKQDIPKRANEPVHTPGEDESISQLKFGCRSTKMKGMRIPEVLLNDVIRETMAYKVYDADFRGVEISTIQPQPVESTRGTQRKTSALWKSKTKQGGEKKGKQVSVEKPVQTAKEIDQANLQEAIKFSKALEIMANAALDSEVEQMVEEGDNLGNLENMSKENDEPDTRAELSSDDDTVGNGPPEVVNKIAAEKVKKYVKENIRSVVKEQLKELLDATAPQQIQEFLRNYMQTNTITINLSSRSTIPDLKQQLYAEMYANPQARAEDPELFEVLKKGLEKAQGGSDTCNLRKRPRGSS
nr:monodehydroascorbate reductase [Tanacetum cinerariifolium]